PALGAGTESRSAGIRSRDRWSPRQSCEKNVEAPIGAASKELIGVVGAAGSARARCRTGGHRNLLVDVDFSMAPGQPAGPDSPVDASSDHGNFDRIIVLTALPAKRWQLGET